MSISRLQWVALDMCLPNSGGKVFGSTNMILCRLYFPDVGPLSRKTYFTYVEIIFEVKYEYLKGIISQIFVVVWD